MLRKTWVFRRTSETLRPGNYEWPFDLILSGDTPESLEGMTETWLVYRMKATIERGMFQQNVIARKQIRMIRTLDPSDLELSHGMVCIIKQKHPRNTAVLWWRLQTSCIADHFKRLLKMFGPTK